MKTEKTAYHHGNLRSEILAAAHSLLNQAGIEGVTIRAVARQIGVAHSAPANHFKDRKTLLTALATGIFEDLGSSIINALATRTGSDNQHDRRARIGVFAETLTQFGLTHPHSYRLLWHKDCLDDADPNLQAGMDRIYDALLAELTPAREGRSSETDAIALWSLLHGYISMRLDGNLVAKADEVSGVARADAIIDALFEGIGQRP